MSDNGATTPCWPPFPIEQLPAEIQPLLEDFRWASLSLHPPVATTALVTVVVPCLDPEPTAFAQLLLSLRQQSDPHFRLLLVNAGSRPEAWRAIGEQIQEHSWIEVLQQPTDAGLAAALNAAVAEVATPYVLLLGQGDLLHPAALDLLQRHLERHRDCGLLYSDHLVFSERGDHCHHVAKVPWHPEAVRECTLLLQRPVVRVDLYRACGGMDDRYKGIQDWEFSLRLAPLLSEASVGYLPVPLFALRQAPARGTPGQRSGEPLQEMARRLLVEAEAQRGWHAHVVVEGECWPECRFRVERRPATGTDPQACSVLVLAGRVDRDRILQTLDGLHTCGLRLAGVFIAQDRDSPTHLAAWAWPEHWDFRPQLLGCSLHGLIERLPGTHPLLVLQAGVLPQADATWVSLPGWLDRSEHWDLLTLPGFSQQGDRCVSAGYARAMAEEPAFLPQGQGLSRRHYQDDVQGWAHTRTVDLPSPTLQLLSRACLEATLTACRDQHAAISQGWWPLLAGLGWRCCCPPEPALLLQAPLGEAEERRIAVLDQGRASLVRAETWIGSRGDRWQTSYRSLLHHRLESGPVPVHPLHVQAFRRTALHPTILAAAERRSGRATLLPPARRRPLVMLMPTELNARSNGHACMLTLALQLKRAGYDIHLLPFKPYTFFSSYLPSLPPVFRELPFISNPEQVPGDAVLLVPESAPRKLVAQLRKHYSEVVWWLLAPVGLLTSFWPDIRRGDRLIAFSEFSLPRQRDYLFVHPKAHALLEKAQKAHVPHSPKDNQIALYTGKGRLKPLPHSLHRQLLPYQVVLITRTFPRTKDGLIRLLTRSKGLISCDPMTNLTLEAANLGVPTFLPGTNPFPERAYQHFPVDLRDFITDAPETFLAWINSKEPPRKLPDKPLYQKGDQAATLIDLLTRTPEPHDSKAYRIDDDMLALLKRYHAQLISSRAIQIDRGGQSMSSALSRQYAFTLKAPYGMHVAFCRVLALIDRATDLLSALGLFHVLHPFINRASRVARVALRPSRTIVRRVIR